jgi:hypothetical protein
MRESLVKAGRSVGDAAVGQIARERGGFGPDLNLVGDPWEEIKVGTQSDGSFGTPDVRFPVDWFLYGKMESLLSRGATQGLSCTASSSEQLLDVSGIQLASAQRLAGRVIRSDLKPLPTGMRVVIKYDRVWDSQTSSLDSNRSFGFAGLSPGDYSVTPSVKGYTSASSAFQVASSMDRDVSDGAIVRSPIGAATESR